MPANLKQVSLSFLAIASALALPYGAEAKWARTWVSVPLKRVLSNVEKIVKENPKDAEAIAVLARLHSLAYWKDEGEHELVLNDWESKKARRLPGFAPYDSMKPTNLKGELSDKAKWHLMRSVHFYQEAIRLKPNDPLNYLGLGYVLHEAYRHDGQYPSSKPNVFRARAIAAYRKAYQLSMSADAKRDSIMENPNSPVISREAGEGLIELLKVDPPSTERDNEIRSIEAHIAALNKKPMMITPIIFSMARYQPMSELLDRNASTTFDLAGDGVARRWPWVKPDTGILVWDPEHKGQVVSGRQLFGSVTWWMFWRDGYQPLVALDNNADGKLSGSELAGIAVWQDRNQNGLSDVGEVMPVEKSGITEIAVKSSGKVNGVPAQRCGLVRNGKWLPTYDWTPTSLAKESPRRAQRQNHLGQVAFIVFGLMAAALSVGRLRALNRAT